VSGSGFPLPPPAEPEPPRRRDPVWTWQDLILLLGLAVPSLTIAALAVGLLAPGAGKTARILAVQFTAYGLWFAGLFALLRTRYQESFWRSLGWVRPARGFGLSALLGPLVALGLAWLGVLLRTPDIDTPIKELMRDRQAVLAFGFFAVTLGPVCEELAFRGFLYPLLARTLGPAVGVVLSALPFGLLHGGQNAWIWQHVLIVTLAGAAFGWARHWTGSTMAATAMHATYNLTFLSPHLVSGIVAP
jgi:membrane protease YdiL (CAAX protease family)